MRTIGKLLPLALAALLLSGCLVSDQTEVEQRGRFVSTESFVRIGPGDSADHVLELLGEPSSRRQVSEGLEVWRWSYSEVRRSKTAVLFVLASDRSTEKKSAVFVELQDGVVTRTWRE